MDACVKQEVAVALSSSSRRDIVSDKRRPLPALPFIDLSDSGSSSEADDDEAPSKKRKLGIIIPEGFLQPLPPLLLLRAVSPWALRQLPQAGATAKQHWKAGDYEGCPGGGWDSYSAFAELLDNDWMSFGICLLDSCWKS